MSGAGGRGRFRRRIGSTGQFPAGKLTPGDEGELAFAVRTESGRVVVEFGTSVHWIGLTADRARELSVVLQKHASRVDPASPRTVGYLLTLSEALHAQCAAAANRAEESLTAWLRRTLAAASARPADPADPAAPAPEPPARP